MTESADEPEALATPESPAPSVKLAETIGIVNALRAKVDNDWYRVIYLNAALIGVMIFFAGEESDFVVARLVVFGFYSFNVAASFGTLLDSHTGLRRATEDLRSFPATPGLTGVQTWLGTQDNRRTMRLQLMVLTTAWALVTYLLLAPIIFGRFP